MGKRILIIEDDASVIQTTKAILERQGYQISVALDGEEGLQKTTQDAPDLVLLDLGLPKVSGLEVCKSIKNNERTKFLPIIMITGRNSDADKIIGKVIGADYYMAKPFNISELLKNISAILKD